MRNTTLLTFALAACSLAGMVSADDWPAFRGPHGNGISTETDLPKSWGAKENVLWKVALNSNGNGSPIVSKGRVFVNVANNNGTERSLHCFDRKNGKELWSKSVSFDEVEATHKTNPYGSSTPVSDGVRVITWHGSAGLICYDFEGKENWKIDLGDVTHEWGYGSSPVIYKDRIFLNFGPGKETAMTAISLVSGDVIWKTKEPSDGKRQAKLVASYSTPVVAKVQGEDQLICTMPTRVVSYDVDSGDILWTVGGIPSPRGELVYTSPLVGDGVGLAMAGYKGPAMAFRLGGNGDVTNSNRLWHVEKSQPQRIGSGVVLGEHAFVTNAGPGSAQCIEVSTGKELWKARIPGGNSWSSTIYGDGKLYVTDQGGTTYVFRPNPEEFELVATNQVRERSNSTPAISDGQLFLRTFKSLYCVAKK